MSETSERRPVARMDVPLEAIRESPTNPRKSPGDLTGLVASIREQGVLQAVRLRPHPDEPDAFELVYGWRRFLASGKAGLETIPADVAPMTDREVCELQLVENRDREDVHPLEEAEALRHLQENHGVSLEDLAVTLGRPKGFVIQRLRLCELAKPLKNAFLAEELRPGEALLLAALWTPQLQEDALAQVLALGPGRTTEEVRALLRSRYTLRLADSPFDRGDEELVPGAGACEPCQYRTGNQRELFADVASADVCTKPDCFKAKSNAAFQARAAKTMAAGGAVLSDSVAKKLFVAGYGELLTSEFQDLDAPLLGDVQGRTLRKALGRGAPQPTLARDGTGRVRELLPSEVARGALKTAGVKLKAPRAAGDRGAARREEPPQDVEKLKRNRETRLRVMQHVAHAVGERVRSDRLTVAGWRVLAALCISDALHAGTVDLVGFVATLGMHGPYGGNDAAAADLEEGIANWKEPALQALVMELHLRLVIGDVSGGTGGLPPLLKEAADVFSVNAKAIEKDVRELEKQEAKDARAKQPSPTARRSSRAKTHASASQVDD